MAYIYFLPILKNLRCYDIRKGFSEVDVCKEQEPEVEERG